ncbi:MULTISPECIES: GDSL-type esterase/lipase family protein [unclassified Modestobacter]|uniref:GDSL-type esterase/lipase family protein n=1 Tax=unclassified Modestobacter TaxID=2643866 RepID=UPI0022AB1420|nr:MULTISPECIES: GDSL-type esterase/lipase family protein [unclassified Modestobacter]MCZ2827132.1 GDSL-type esterase/lipase family protein [Modestobacter sp. VKM Ac-2981]MCZ2854383.1 GDSL-type esterase/lipase family protein [Modestobacter sp. VKM Ac-2982]
MTLHFLVLGDSLAFGTGAATVQDTVGARLTRALVQAGHDVDLQVVAVPGATSLDLDAQVRRVTGPVDVALLVVGANDLTRQVSPVRAAAALGAAVQELRGAGASVLVVPTPDLSSVAWVPPAFRAVVAGLCDQLRTRQSVAAARGGAVVAPVAPELSRRFAADPALFSADRFHPSSAGYALVAEALAPALLRLAAERTDAAA